MRIAEQLAEVPQYHEGVSQKALARASMLAGALAGSCAP